MIRKEVLANGLSLLTESMPDVRSVCIGIWLRRGSRDELKMQNGSSHFIEHLVFKGTESRSAREIALTMDSVGGQMDAFTSKEYTCFYAKVLDEHLPVAIDLLADIVQRPLFAPEELERERQVVLEEIRMVEDSPDELIYDLFSEFFYPGQALGRPIQGTAETVSAFSRRQLLSHFRGSYRPANMMIVAAGNLQHARTRRLVREAFSALERGRPFKRKTPPTRSATGITTRNKKELEQLHLLLGLPAFCDDLKLRYPLFVLNTILGGTMSSRLFQTIREERGLAYSVYSAVNTFIDSGFMAVYAATNPANGAEVVSLIVKELRDLRDNGPKADELRVAKEHLKGSLMLALESTSSRMSNLARQEIYFGRQVTLAETLRGVNSVTVRQVHQMARELLSDRSLALALVGKIGRMKLSEQELRL
jgi:predicted Zn-dependent peptidase